MSRILSTVWESAVASSGTGTGIAVAVVATTTALLVALKLSANGPRPYRPAPGSLTSKVILITGGTTGLGLESAKRLAAGGATIILTARTQDKGKRAVAQVKDYVWSQGGSDSASGAAAKELEEMPVYFVQLELTDLDNVRSFPQRLASCPPLLLSNKQKTKKIDVLMHNAGIGNLPQRTLTKDGYEETFQVNHLAPFLLTHVLMDWLNSEQGARILIVSSLSHLFLKKKGGLPLDNLNSEREYHPYKTYCTTKLANMLFGQELQRRLTNNKTNIKVVTLTPGLTRSDHYRHVLTGGLERLHQLRTRPTFRDYLWLAPLWIVSRSVERGASTQVWSAACGEKPGEEVQGQFYQNGKPNRLSPIVTDPVAAQKLWQASEKMTQIQFLPSEATGTS